MARFPGHGAHQELAGTVTTGFLLPQVSPCIQEMPPQEVASVRAP